MNTPLENIEPMPRSTTRELNEEINEIVSDYGVERSMFWLLLLSYKYYQNVESKWDWVDYQLAVEEIHRERDSE